LGEEEFLAAELTPDFAAKKAAASRTPERSPGVTVVPRTFGGASIS
jgi:hypothetical protein